MITGGNVQKSDSLSILDHLFLWLTTNTVEALANLASPIKSFTGLDIDSTLEDIVRQLRGKSGIYAFICMVDGKQYIGSAQDLYHRMQEHLNGRKSNVLLQRALGKHGIPNFIFVVYKFAPYTIPAILELETLYISLVPSNMLYNIRLSATSMLGYNHTAEAIAKMVARLANPINHPMYGKTHTIASRLLISKPGPLNPMYGKHHSPSTIAILSALKSQPVYLYDLDNVFVQEFISATAASAYFGVHKTTIGRYVQSGKVFQNKYYLRNSRV